MAAGALGEGVGGWPETSNELILRNGTWVGGIEVEVGIVNISVDVAGLVSNDLEDVGHAVPAAEGWKPPVYRDGGDGGVVVVEGRVSGTLKSVRDDATEKDGEDVVMLGVGLVLVEGEDDERVVHEIAVVQQRLEEVTGPGASKGDIGVMAIVGHIGGDEGPLGKGLGLQIILEGGEVLDEAETGGILGDGVKENERVVLADISVGVGLLVGEVEAWKPAYGKPSWYSPQEIPLTSRRSTTVEMLAGKAWKLSLSMPKLSPAAAAAYSGSEG